MSRGSVRLLAEASAKLAEAGLESPQADARLLLLHASGLSITELLTTSKIDARVVEKFNELIDQRAAGIPVQHLTGEAWFRNVRLEVGPGVFVPRPETELVAGAAIAEAGRLTDPLVVELCAGSGAISAALVDEVADARVIAIEKDPVAARWLRRNLGSTAVEVVEADMADALPDLTGQVAIVVANPPYLPWSAGIGLPADVGGHDPAQALFADDHGLAAIRVVIEVARRLLSPDGLVVIEHGDDQGPAVLDELKQGGFREGVCHHDLAGRPRFVTGRRMSGWSGD